MTGQSFLVRSGATTQVGYPLRLPALTSMRFFAAAWVVAMHYSWWLPSGGDELPILPQGGMAVDFFFVLSGFVLAHAHFVAVIERRLEVRNFLVRRLARIYPMHVATIGFYGIMVAAATLLSVPLPNPDRYGSWQLALNLTLLHALQMHDAGAWNYPSWSISAEWIAYLAFPFIAGAILQFRNRTAGGTAILCGSGVVLAWALGPQLFKSDFFDLHTNFGWARALPEFALGVALYAWGRTRELPILALPIALPILCAAVILLAWNNMKLAMLVPLSLLILAGAEQARSGGFRFLSSPHLIYAGEISYALYMVHLPVATIVLRGSRGSGGATPVWALALAAIAAIALAMASHRYLEGPGSRLIMRLSPTARRQA